MFESEKGHFSKNIDNNTNTGIFRMCLSGELKLPTITTHIGELAFDYNQITKAVLPDSLKTIGSEAFKGCQLLQEVVFPEKLTTIGQYAFYDCIRLHTGTLKSKTLRKYSTRHSTIRKHFMCRKVAEMFTPKA